MTPELGVVVLSLDRWQRTETMLQSLGGQTGLSLETIVVDNGSAAEVLHRLADCEQSALGRRLRLRTHLNPSNVGIASGRNQGASLSSAPTLLFLDNDVELIDPTSIGRIVQVARRNPSFGAVGGVLLNADPARSIQFAGGRVDTRGRVTFETDCGSPTAARSHARLTMFCLGACLLTPHALFDDVGGFDCAFDPMHYEDVDYCLRLAHQGFSTAIATEARLLHHAHSTTGEMGFARLQYYLRSGRIFVRRWAASLPDLSQPPSLVDSGEGR